MATKQFTVTSAMGKRLIARALVRHPAVKQALAGDRTLVIVAGTTNGYVAEEILRQIGQADGFSRMGFRRGVVIPPAFGSLPQTPQPADVVITAGRWQRDKTIFDVAENLEKGDVILKGGNALDLPRRAAAVLIGHPQVGTAGAALAPVIGRRATMIVPIGLEKRICGDLAALAAKINSPDAEGPRMMLLPGAAFTELDAIELLTGARPELVAAGGIYGAEGAVWLAISGTPDQLQSAEALLGSLAAEPPCQA